MVSPEQVGKTIIRLRKLRGLSQEKFALESGIDRRYLSDVENGKRNVSFELLNRIANYFNVSLSCFFAEVERPVTFASIEQLRGFLIERCEEDSTFFTEPDFIEAIVGISADGRLVYSHTKMVESLVLGNNMSHDDAIEFIEHNTFRALSYMGNKCPIILYNIDY